MSAEELDETLPMIAAGPVTWDELLDSRFEGNRVLPFSVGQARYDLARSKGIPYVRNQFRLDQFAAVFARIREMYAHRIDPEST